MTDSGEGLLLPERSDFDINENMPNTQNCSTDEFIINAPSSIVYSESDSACIETSNSSESFDDGTITLETRPEISSKCDFETDTKKNEYDANNIPDSGIHDSENNMVVNAKLIEFDANELTLSDNCGVFISDFIREENDSEFKDEEFHDAVQFFKDPSSLVFLENAGSSSAPSEPSMTRSSLYQKFDPLHAKFFSHSNIKSTELHEIAEDEIEPEHEVIRSACIFDKNNKIEAENNSSDVLVDVQNEQKNLSPVVQKDSVSDIINKNLSNITPRQSIGNILISFDSPVMCKELYPLPDNKVECDPPKIYTEEMLQQTLKIQELTIQETFLKKQQEIEECFLKKQRELESRTEQYKNLSNSLSIILKEAINLVYVFSDKEKQLTEKLQISEKETNKLKEDLKTSVEDIQSVETTFSDFHKRYEQCKNMLKVYTENEKSLMQQLENMSIQCQEREEMYKALQCRTQEMLDKANNEVVNVKRAGDAQVAVLKAQLKKAELKISSLESDVKHVKIENGKLSTICDELMAKVSET